MNILTFDVEDWLTSSLELFPPDFKPSENLINASLRYARKNVLEIINILSEFNVKATFFVSGRFAEKYPEIVKKIHRLGHEVGSHSYSHTLIYKIGVEEFKKDIGKSKYILEQLTEAKIVSFRAPYFSIKPGTEWAFEILAELGFLYDSSIFPIKRKLYGYPNWPRKPQKIKVKSEAYLWEFPITTLKIGKLTIPFGGGGYFRILPFKLIKYGIKRLHTEGLPAIIYFHPYELNPHEFRDENFKNLPKRITLSQNIGRKFMKDKLKKLLKEFEFTSIREFVNINRKNVA